MIRGDLGFTGIVISDDLGNAKQVARWSPGARAVDFISAGGDIVLTVNPSVIPAMVNAVTARAASDTVFRCRVQAAVLRVLTVKAQYGLLGRDCRSRATSARRRRRPCSAGSGSRKPAPRQHDDPGTAGTDRRPRHRHVGAGLHGRVADYLWLYRDGATTWNTRTVAGLQRYLNTQL